MEMAQRAEVLVYRPDELSTTPELKKCQERTNTTRSSHTYKMYNSSNIDSATQG